MKKAFKLNSNLPPLNLPLSAAEQKRGLFNDYKSQSAFTLIELAIVVVVLGILVSGVVAGQSLIESSKANSVISDIQKYQMAIRAFELEYSQLPGDFDEAEDYWGSVSGNCLIVEGSGTETCNGNGNRIVDPIDPSLEGQNNETWRVWEHLFFANIINKEYTGIGSGGCIESNRCIKPGINAPEGAFDNSAWNFFHMGANNSRRGKNSSRHVLVFHAPNEIYNDAYPGPALRAKHQFAIDKKIDDGKPFMGTITSMSSPITNLCATSRNLGATNATYRLNWGNDPIEEKKCIMLVDFD
jgi:prepilin-type N-terminal cleavage/methylation domain-containing protein